MKILVDIVKEVIATDIGDMGSKEAEEHANTTTLRIIGAQWTDVVKGDEDTLPRENYRHQLLIEGNGFNSLTQKEAIYQYRGYFANGVFYEHEGHNPRKLNNVTRWMYVPK